VVGRLKARSLVANENMYWHLMSEDDLTQQ
jgi:hypothetical protein